MLISLTIVRYRKRFIPLALLSMAVFRLPLWLNAKCKFWKLMGCGKNRTFDLRPDFQQWALLTTWQQEKDFHVFLNSSFIARYWKIFAAETYTILCKPITSHGKWDGKNPFETTNKEETDGVIAVLTRATIRMKKVGSFWKNVGKVADIMSASPGYITSFGIGEAPLYLQATFSVWENPESVKAFAYQSGEHVDVIRKTRQDNWYSEELFARFKPLATFGTLNGSDPLTGKL